MYKNLIERTKNRNNTESKSFIIIFVEFRLCECGVCMVLLSDVRVCDLLWFGRINFRSLVGANRKRQTRNEAIYQKERGFSSEFVHSFQGGRHHSHCVPHTKYLMKSFATAAAVVVFESKRKKKHTMLTRGPYNSDATKSIE